MHHRFAPWKTASIASLILVFVLHFHAVGHAGQKSTKLPVPAKQAQTEAFTLILELYADQYAKSAKDRNIKVQLAITLLNEGKETDDYPAGKYVLYREARDLAAEAGDSPTALQAIAEMSQSFRFAPEAIFQLKIRAFDKASKAAATQDAYHTMIDGALVLLADALDADNYADALRLAQTAEAAARKLRSISLVSSMRKRIERVEAMKKEYQRWEPFAKILRTNPKDAKANLEMGKYQALIKGNWQRGLPMIARGTKSPLQQAARHDLAGADSFNERLKLAEQWRSLAKNYDGKMKNHVLLRAYFWFQNALVDATTAKVRKYVESHMDKILAQLPAEYRVGQITTQIQDCSGHFGPVYTGAISPDGGKAITGGMEGSLSFWDVKSGRELRRFNGHSSPVWTVAFAPDGRTVLSGGFDNLLRLFDLAGGRQIREFSGHADYVRCAVFSRDGRFVVSCGDDRTIRIWSAATGTEIRKLIGHKHFVWGVALSPNGKYVASASLDRTVRIWDFATGKELKTLTGHRDTVLSVAFAPDGRRVLSGSTDKTLKLWDIETGKLLKTLVGHDGYVHSVSFSPDGRRALSASQDQTVRLWDVYSGEVLQVLKGHTDQVWSVSFSADGRSAISTGQDRKALIWGGDAK